MIGRGLEGTKLDRRTRGESRMCNSVLVDFEDFKQSVLPSLPSEATTFEKMTIHQKERLFKKFNQDFDKDRLAQVADIEFTQTVVNLINSVGLPNGYKAATCYYHNDKTHSTHSVVDAALYARGQAPKDCAPDWSSCQGSTPSDPFDDCLGWNAGSMTPSHTEVRSQLIAHAWNIFLYQHRNCFRAIRWDRAGVVASRKVNYVEDPESLLGFLWHFVQLDDVTQGIDPTAKLVRKGSKAFDLMVHLSQPDSDLDLDDWEDAEVTIPEVAPGPTTTHTCLRRTFATRAPYYPGTTTRSTTRLACSNTNAQYSPCSPPLRAIPFRVLPTNDDLPRHYDDDNIWADDPPYPPSPPCPTILLLSAVYVHRKFAETIENWPYYKLKVGPDDRIFLVGKPIFKSLAMFGRATRGYIALDVLARRFVFLKDSWRPFYVGVKPEGMYLEKFAGDTRFVHPTVVCHGDVGEQQTFTAAFHAQKKSKSTQVAVDSQRPQQSAPAAVLVSDVPVTAGTKRVREAEDEVEDELPQGPSGSATKAKARIKESNGPLRHHTHYRIVVKEVCLPFDEFKTTEQLIRLMFDCIRAHWFAYSEYKIMHRDVSAGNVLIFPVLTERDDEGKQYVEWNGFLTDWELAKTVVEDPAQDKARQPERTGTWQFMSAAYIAANWSRPIEVADELKSFFHVTLFYAVRFLRNNLPSVSQFVIEYFDTFQMASDGGLICSRLKRTTLHLGVPEGFSTPTLQFLKRGGQEGNPLNDLIAKLLFLFKGRYEYLEYLARPKKVPKTPSAAPRRNGPSARRNARRHTMLDSWRVDNDYSGVDPAPVAEEPSAQALNSQRILEHHGGVMKLFDDALEQAQSEDWDDTGVVGYDQLVDYDPGIYVVAVKDATQSNVLELFGVCYGISTCCPLLLLGVME
ncbi:hypothetical protein C8Q79DRAFT_1112190 [Trametes meyenii]|nr:hypothetical protein C8Q79DRAFT_1112190 [Trametes meyenii]